MRCAVDRNRTGDWSSAAGCLATTCRHKLLAPRRVWLRAPGFVPGMFLDGALLTALRLIRRRVRLCHCARGNPGYDSACRDALIVTKM